MMASWFRIQAIFFKELIQLKRDRMTFGMVIMIPLVQLMLFGYAINTNIREIPVAVVDQSQTSLSRVLIQTVRATQVVKFEREFQDIKSAEDALKRSEIRAVLIIPHDLGQRVARHPSSGFGSYASSDEETSRPIAQWVVDGADTAIAATIKSLRNMPLTE